jgi:hypothetical protein
VILSLSVLALVSIKCLRGVRERMALRAREAVLKMGLKSDFTYAPNGRVRPSGLGIMYR